MQRTILFFTALIFVCTLVHAQQIVFSESLPRVNSFNSRYERRTTVNLNALPLLREKAVKKVSFYRANDALFSFIELDENGTITGEAYQESYYFWVRRKQLVGSDTLISTAWYREGLLERTDTIFILPRSYSKGDTLMRFTVYDTVVYKSGKLLNEQNMYLNNRLNQGYKTNYEDELLFLCSIRGDNTGFSATVHGGYISIVEEVSTNGHPFYARYLKTPEDVVFVEGENVIEPVLPGMPMLCGTAVVLYSAPPEEVLNERGLFDSEYVFLSDEGRTLSFYASYEYYKKQ